MNSLDSFDVCNEFSSPSGYVDRIIKIIQT